MRLTGPNFRQLHHALLDAFDRDELAVLVRTALDQDLDDIAGDGRFSRVVHKLITWVERHDRVADLVRAAAADKPGNATLRAVAAEFSTWQPATRLSAHDAVVRQPAAWVPVLALGVAALALAVLLLRGGSFAGFGSAAAGRPDEQLAAAPVPTATPTATFAPTAAPTPAPPTPTPLPFPTARPSEYLIVVSAPGPDSFPDFNARGTLRAALDDALGAAGAINYRVETMALIPENEVATIVGAAGARQLVLAVISRADLEVSVRQLVRPQHGESVMIGDIAPPDTGFSAIITREMINTFLAPYVAGLHFFDIGEPGRAVGFFDSALAAVEGEELQGIEHLWLIKGSAHYALKEYDAALAAFDQALQARPNLKEAMRSRAVTLDAQGDLSGALQEADKLVQQNRFYGYGYATRGNLRWSKGDLDGAAEDMEEAISLLLEVDKDHAYETMLNLAVVYYSLDRPNDAVRHLEAIVGPEMDCAPLYIDVQWKSDEGDDFCSYVAYLLAELYLETGTSDVPTILVLAQLGEESAVDASFKGMALSIKAKALAADGQDEEACSAGKQAMAIWPEGKDQLAVDLESLCPATNPP